MIKGILVILALSVLIALALPLIGAIFATILFIGLGNLVILIFVVLPTLLLAAAFLLALYAFFELID